MGSTTINFSLLSHPPYLLWASLPSSPWSELSRGKPGIDSATCGIICISCTLPGKKVVWSSPLPENTAPAPHPPAPPWLDSLECALPATRQSGRSPHSPISWAIPLLIPGTCPFPAVARLCVQKYFYASSLSGSQLHYQYSSKALSCKDSSQPRRTFKSYTEPTYSQRLKHNK